MPERHLTKRQESLGLFSTQTHTPAQKMKEMREEGRREGCLSGWAVVPSGIASARRNSLSLSSLQWRRNQDPVSQTTPLSSEIPVYRPSTVCDSPSTKPPSCGHPTNMLFRRPSFYHASLGRFLPSFRPSFPLPLARICFPYIVNHLCSLGRAFSSETGAGGGGGGKDKKAVLSVGDWVA